MLVAWPWPTSKACKAARSAQASNTSQATTLEFERNTISSEIGERALREIYLPAFEAAVREAGSWTVMSSYNKINGAFSSENHWLLTGILKDEWAFEGAVMSDWFGTHSTAPALNAGLDLEMPGPTQWRGQKLVQAVQNGEVTQEAVTQAAGRFLHLIERVGAFDHPDIPEEADIDLPAHREVARRAAAEAIVLLKNRDSVLPLDPGKLSSVAIIGPNAKTAQIMGGGSARVNAHYAITPFDGITAQLGPGVKVGYEIGCTNHKYTPLIPLNNLSTSRDSTEHGLTITYYNSLDLSGEPIWQTTLLSTETVWLGEIGHGVNMRAFSARISGFFTPDEFGPRHHQPRVLRCIPPIRGRCGTHRQLDLTEQGRCIHGRRQRRKDSRAHIDRRHPRRSGH